MHTTAAALEMILVALVLQAKGWVAVSNAIATKRRSLGASELVLPAISLAPDRSCCPMSFTKRLDSGKPASNQLMRRKIDRWCQRTRAEQNNVCPTGIVRGCR